MKLRLANIRFGFTFLLFSAVIGGMMLGVTFNEQSIQDGNHLLSLARFYMREGHSHGNFMAFFNIFVGLTLNNLNLTEKAKKIASYSAMAAVMLPIGLALQGLAGAPADFPPIGMIGILGITMSLVILIMGSFKTKEG